MISMISMISMSSMSSMSSMGKDIVLFQGTNSKTQECTISTSGYNNNLYDKKNSCKYIVFSGLVW